MSVYRQNRKTRRRFSRRFKLLCGGAAAALALAAGVGLAIYTASRPPSVPSAASVPPEAADAEEEGIVVAIDPGHGGSDQGASGLVDESEITAWTAQALYALLEADGRFAPVLTKDYGDAASVDDRAEAAGLAGAELLVSIHCNSDASPDSSGFECYALPPGWDGHEESAALGVCVAAAVEAGTDLRIRGENGVRYMYFSPAGERRVAEYSDQSAYGAETFGLLDRVGCPGVLIEQFFVTSSSDAARYGSQEGCARLARCYYEAICSYLRLDGEDTASSGDQIPPP